MFDGMNINWKTILIMMVFCGVITVMSAVGFGLLLNNLFNSSLMADPTKAEVFRGFAPVVSGIAAIMSVSVALINILLGISFFLTEKSRKIDENILIRKQFWLREVFLKRKIEVIENLFGVAQKLAMVHFFNNPCEGVASLRDEFSKMKRMLSSSLIVEMGIIDNKISDKLDEVIDELQDFVTICATGSGNGVCYSENEVFVKIQMYKKKFMGLIYDCEMNMR